MRALILLCLIAILAGWGLSTLLQDYGSGYVWVYYGNYSVETSFWFFLLILALVMIAVYCCYKLAVNLFYLSSIPKRLGINRANQLQQQGLVAYSESSWQQAEAALAKLFKKQKSFSIALLAARAALAQSDIKKCEQHYEQAYKANNAHEFSLRLLRLDIDLAKDDIAAVRGSLSQLINDFPNQPSLHEKALSFYLEQENWSKAETHFIKLNKKAAKNNQWLRNQGITLYQALITESLIEQGPQFEEYYQTLKKLLVAGSTQEQQLEQQLARYLAASDNEKALRKQIQQAFKQQQYTVAANALYAAKPQWFEQELSSWQEKLQANNPTEDNAAYWHCQAVMHCRNEQYKHAIDDYSKSLAQNPKQALWLELAKVYQLRGEQDKAIECMEHII